MSVQITVSDNFKAVVDKIQKFKGFDKPVEAVDYIGQVFTSRFKAVQKYAEKGGTKAGKKTAKRAGKKTAKKAAKKAAPASKVE